MNSMLIVGINSKKKKNTVGQDIFMDMRFSRILTKTAKNIMSANMNLIINDLFTKKAYKIEF